MGYHNALKIYEAQKLCTVYVCAKMNSSRPSWVDCVPKMAYFCSNGRHLNHKTVNNFGTNKDMLMKFVVDDHHDFNIE